MKREEHIKNEYYEKILWGYVTSIFRAEMSNCHISHKNVTHKIVTILRLNGGMGACPHRKQ